MVGHDKEAEDRLQQELVAEEVELEVVGVENMAVRLAEVDGVLEMAVEDEQERSSPSSQRHSSFQRTAT